MRIVRKGLLILAVTLVVAILGIVLAMNLSPKPFIYWFRGLPDPGPSAPANYAHYEQLVDVHQDITYPSKFKSNTLDIYYPKGSEDPKPTILWVHGGAFVAGDKSGTAYWCTMMASKGYTVVSMNYEVAPEAHYPAPIIQMTEVYQYLKTVEDSYPTLDMQRLIVGGDSAGAQIASQFIAVQTNSELAESLELPQILSKDTLKAALLYCGPYNVKQLANVEGRLERFFLNQLGWSYIGKRDWRDGTEAEQASTVNYVTSEFPPTFITDGNSGSFESHGRELEQKLEAVNVPVASLYYPLSYGVVNHEYQFKLDTVEAMECFEQTLSFLDEHLQESANKS